MTSRTYTLFMAARRAAQHSSQAGEPKENMAKMGNAFLVQNSAVWPTPQLSALKAEMLAAAAGKSRSRAMP